jgi:hypothetical protein
MPKYTTDICAHCGADRGLHQFETDLCPRFGRESFPAPQQWDETKFEDAGEKRLRDAAPELLAKLKEAVQVIQAWHNMNERNEDQAKRMWDIYYTMAPEMRPIRELLEKFPNT